MNLPNFLTLLRMLMVPVVVVLFVQGRLSWALAFFLLAGLTDVLDGYLARRNHQITNFGKVMDPLADKLMLLTTLICLCVTYHIPLWVPIVIGVKECTMITVAGLLYRKDIVLPANLFGKLATVLFTIAVVLSFFSDRVAPWHTVLLYLATGVAIFAMIYYGVIVLRSNPQLFHKRNNA